MLRLIKLHRRAPGVSVVTFWRWGVTVRAGVWMFQVGYDTEAPPTTRRGHR